MLFLNGQDASRVPECRLDLEPIPDNAGIRKQAAHIPRIVSGHTLAIEGVKGFPIVLTPLEDR